MKKHSIIKAIISNVTVCLIALVFLVSSIFSWFAFIYKSQTEHRVSIGKYEVDIRTLSLSGIELSIDLKNMYPMTAQLAYADTSQNHLYRFEILNSGSVYSMYRFLIKATDEYDFMPLSRQLKYSMRVGFSLEEIDSYLESEVWFFEDYYVFDDLLKDKDSNYTLQSALDLFTVVPDPAGDTFEVYGEVKSGESMYYDIYFWLGEKATLDSANEDIGGGILRGKKTTLTFNTYFMQSVGGAKWPLEWADTLKPATP